MAEKEDCAALPCPWCGRHALKDDACNYVVCGRDARGFVIAHGCARAWCFRCGKKLCGPPTYDVETGAQLHFNEDHDHPAGSEQERECSREEYCPGGHNSHKSAKK